jgi:crotonobetainyl-CoA:carnitine CoA-transferase CaiB-like acyl-CoA transferase
MGSAHPLNAPYQAFATADGWINVGAANQRNWDRMVEAIGAPQLLNDPRFSSNRTRMENLPALVAALAPIFRSRSTAEWLTALAAAEVPAGPVLSVSAMHQDPQTIAREMIVDVDHPTAGRMKTIGLPIKFGSTPGGVRRPAPLLGEHTGEVLKELGDANVS